MLRSIADVVVQALVEEGVTHTFGIPGTHNIELYDALDRRREITPVLVTDEQAASFAADGLARATGEVGVVNLVPGAGVTHALSGIAEAFMDGIPLLVLTCGIRTDTGAAYQLHDIDQLALLAPVTKLARRAEHPDEVYPLLRQAFALARAGTPGPVAVEIPANFYLIRQEIGELVAPPKAPPPAVDEGLVQEAATLLNAAKRPVLYVGYGARAAGEAIVRVAEALQAPVATTIQGKGVFPEQHPLFLWNGLGAAAPPFVRKLTARCDALLAVGCRFSEVGTGSYGFKPPKTLIHVDINPEVFHRNFPAQLAVAADAEAFLGALAEQLTPRPRSEALAAGIADGHRAVREQWERHSSKSRVTPARLLAALTQLAPRAIFATDSGNGTFLAMEHLRLDAPGRFLAPVDYSCMGYAVPAALGAKLAQPDRDVIALAGDGAFLMTGLELATASAYGAGVVVCLLRDGELAQIAQFQRTTLNRAACSVLSPYRADALAQATGAAYLRADKDDDLAQALGEAVHTSRQGRPVLLEVAIDYSRKTYFTKGVVITNLWRLPWRERVRMVSRAISRRLAKTTKSGS